MTSFFTVILEFPQGTAVKKETDVLALPMLLEINNNNRNNLARLVRLDDSNLLVCFFYEECRLLFLSELRNHNIQAKIHYSTTATEFTTETPFPFRIGERVHFVDRENARICCDWQNDYHAVVAQLHPAGECRLKITNLKSPLEFIHLPASPTQLRKVAGLHQVRLNSKKYGYYKSIDLQLTTSEIQVMVRRDSSFSIKSVEIIRRQS
jgi:hypothetical protein